MGEIEHDFPQQVVAREGEVETWVHERDKDASVLHQLGQVVPHSAQPRHQVLIYGGGQGSVINHLDEHVTQQLVYNHRRIQHVALKRQQLTRNYLPKCYILN